MGRHVTLRARYRNNKYVNHGLFDGRNCDQVPNRFDHVEIKLLMNRFFTATADKKLSAVTVTVNKSDSKGRAQTLKITIGRNELHWLIPVITRFLEITDHRSMSSPEQEK